MAQDFALHPAVDSTYHPRMSDTTTSPPRGDRRRRNGWNLVLPAPLLMLVTPWLNRIEPRLFGMPLFYWSQFAWVAVGVACVVIVNATARARRDPTARSGTGATTEKAGR